MIISILSFKMPLKNCFLFIAFIGLFSCEDFGQIKFDKLLWVTKNDREFHYRNKMLKDLTTNFKLTKIKYVKIVDLLGESDFSDSNSLSYRIIESYGLNIDPVYTKNLEFEFDKDSVIVYFKITEWKN